MKAIATLTLVALLTACGQQKPEIYSTDAGAIEGYDPVSYFNGKPSAGSTRFSTEWKGATWYFSSAENRETFTAAPESYAPQYGGYCAYAISQGYTAAIDPMAYKVVEGKLYLNYSEKIQKKWEADQDEYIMYADANWPKVLQN